MDNSIAAILEMDKKARQTYNAASEKAEQTLADAKKTIEDLRNGTGKDAAERIAALEAKQRELKADSDSRIAEFEKQADEKCRTFDELMAANKAVWKKEILDRILSV